MEFIVFKNRQVIYRQESFGGILYYRSKLFLLNEEQFQFLKIFDKYKYYNKLKKNEKKIVNEFLKWQIFLKINSNKGEEIIKSSG